ncbi:MAG TPA: Rid family detoxifying hydrolase [Anaerolineales bacterium]
MTAKGREVLVPDKAPKAIGPYSLGIRSQGFVFASGTIGIDLKTGKMVPGGVEAETRQALLNLGNILESGGSSLSQVVKTTVFLVDIGQFARMNQVYAEFFPEGPPARSTVQVVALPGGAQVEVEAIAAVGRAIGD